jgi:hypothetical protein
VLVSASFRSPTAEVIAICSPTVEIGPLHTDPGFAPLGLPSARGRDWCWPR